MAHPISNETRYRLLRYVEDHPHASQRELAQHLGISLGKVNYCLHALMEKGLLKMRNFTRSSNKLAYGYYLTPEGLEEKVTVTYEYLRIKMAEYDSVVDEIERLSKEVAQAGHRVQDVPAETSES